jgi:hypothetical protein
MKMLRARYCQDFRVSRDGGGGVWFLVGFGMSGLRIRLTGYIKSLMRVGWVFGFQIATACANGVWKTARFARSQGTALRADLTQPLRAGLTCAAPTALVWSLGPRCASEW